MSNDTQVQAHMALVDFYADAEHWSDRHGAATRRAAVEASARQLAEQGAPAGSVKIPTGEDEAALMVLTGMAWLKDNAPHRLKQPEQAAPGFVMVPVEPTDPFAGHVEHETKQTPYGPATSYRRAPDAAVPMVPSRHEKLTLNLYGTTPPPAPVLSDETIRLAQVALREMPHPMTDWHEAAKRVCLAVVGRASKGAK